MTRVTMDEMTMNMMTNKPERNKMIIHDEYRDDLSNVTWYLAFVYWRRYDKLDVAMANPAYGPVIQYIPL